MGVQIELGGTLSPPLQDVVAESRRAADAGVTGLWWPDHLVGFFPQAIWSPEFGVAAEQPSPDALLDPFIATAVAAVSARIPRVGLVVTDPFRRHPAVLLQAAASVASTGSAFALGIGAGAPANLEPYGIGLRGRFQDLVDAIAAIRILRDREGAVWAECGKFSLSGGVLAIRERREVSIWLGGSGERFLELAGEVADGWIPTHLNGPEYARQLQILWSSAQNAGRPRPRASMFCWSIVAENHDVAHELLEAPILKSLLFFRAPAYFQAIGLEHPLAGVASSTRYLPSALSTAEAAAAIERVPFDLLHEYIVHGSPAEVRDWVGALEVYGLTHIILYDIARYLANGRRHDRTLELFQ